MTIFQKNSRLPRCSLLALGFLVAACSRTAPTDTGPTAIVNKIVSDPQVIQVPMGEPPELDGILDPDEWAQALQLDMTNGGKVYFQHNGDFLYVGILAEGLGYGHLCWRRDDQVWILHSSASLGSAAYLSDESGWRPIWDYDWCCGSAISTVERQALLEREGWTASIGYLGGPNQMEYQIAWEGQIRLGVIYQNGETFSTAFVWPPILSDACLTLAAGASDLIDPASFNFESWGVLIDPES